MEDLKQVYKELLNMECDVLERGRRKEYEDLVDDFTKREMVREGIHIEKALELEIQYSIRFIDYALSQFERLIHSHAAHNDLLENICRESITLFFSKSLQRMIAITMNVRSPVKEEYMIEPLEKVKSEAFRKLEIVKAKKEE